MGWYVEVRGAPIARRLTNSLPGEWGRVAWCRELESAEEYAGDWQRQGFECRIVKQ